MAIPTEEDLRYAAVELELARLRGELEARFSPALLRLAAWLGRWL